MSTRANVKITDPVGNVIWLYKHHDGYPTHTGDLLHWQFTTCGSLQEVINNLTKNDGFEETTMKHGDIDWCYYINLYEHQIQVYIKHIINKQHINVKGEYNYTKEEKIVFEKKGSDPWVWNNYKVFESNMGIAEAKHRKRMYQGIVDNHEGYCFNYDKSKLTDKLAKKAN